MVLFISSGTLPCTGQLTTRPRLPVLNSHSRGRSTIHCRAAAGTKPNANRAVVVLPGLGNNTGDYAKLQSQLKDSYGLHVEVAQVSRLDWARNAAGLLDTNYWAGTLKPRPTVDWYLERIQAAVEAAKTAAPEDAQITLLAHSAGGWLGRLYLLDFDRTGIDRFVSLGSPHLAPPPGVVDQTRGILTFVSQACPGAHHNEIQYVTVAGRYIRGAPLLGPGGWQERIVGAGYQQVCGDAAVWGDGVVPVPAAHLEGALQLTLDGVYHSPLGSEEGSEASGGTEMAAVAAVEAAEGGGGLGGREDISKERGVAGVTGETGAGNYDSDDYQVSLGEVEAAAAQKIKPGPRVWYGSKGVLEQWVECLWTSEGVAVPSSSSSAAAVIES